MPQLDFNILFGVYHWTVILFFMILFYLSFYGLPQNRAVELLRKNIGIFFKKKMFIYDNISIFFLLKRNFILDINYLCFDFLLPYTKSVVCYWFLYFFRNMPKRKPILWFNYLYVF